jgi:hypothetical protein
MLALRRLAQVRAWPRHQPAQRVLTRPLVAGRRRYLTFRTFSSLPPSPAFDALRELARSPALVRAARACLGCAPSEPLEHATKFLDKPPLPLGASRSCTPPHQDQWYFAHVARSRQPSAAAMPAPEVSPELVSLWIPLDPVDESNGGLRYARGSHLPRRL